MYLIRHEVETGPKNGSGCSHISPLLMRENDSDLLIRKLWLATRRSRLQQRRRHPRVRRPSLQGLFPATDRNCCHRRRRYLQGVQVQAHMRHIKSKWTAQWIEPWVYIRYELISTEPPCSWNSPCLQVAPAANNVPYLVRNYAQRTQVCVKHLHR